MSKIKIQDLTFREMIPSAEIEAAVKRVAAQITCDYATAEQPPIIISVLNGAFIFTADLCRNIDLNVDIEFVKYSSYDGTSSSGNVKGLIGLNCSIQGRDVIVVDDIIDSGTTMVHIVEILQALNPRSVKCCSLFFKPDSYRQSLKVDYAALNIGSEFIVGYGLDYNEGGRNLKDIYVVCDDE